MEKSFSRKRTAFKMLSYIKKYIPLFVISIIFAIINVTMTLYVPKLSGDATDLIISKGNVDFKGLKNVLLMMAVFTVTGGLSQWLMTLCNNRITYHIIKKIRRDAFGKIQELPLKYIDSNPTGEVVSKIITDVDQMADGLLMGFSQFFTGIATIIGTLVFMAIIDMRITLMVVCLTPISLFVASFIAKRTYSMFKVQSETRAMQTALVDEMIGNIKVVKAFGKEKDVTDEFDTVNKELQDCSLKATFYSSLVNPSTRFVNSLVYAGVAILGGFIAISGRISVGMLQCLLIYANQYTKPFNEISGVATELQNALACAARVFDLIEEENEFVEGKEILLSDEIEGRVEVNNVSFSYTKEKKLIENMNLKVEPGKRVAIVGPTGCGKTTIINLLMRFYDTDKGSICVDGKNIRNLNSQSLRRCYGMVLQETWLKEGTIRENIVMGREGISEEELIAAAKSAHAHSFIKRLPNGYDTVIKEDGGNLSQGQKQLLCIARVMLRLPNMLILDEATSSVDTRTEQRIQRAFEKMMADRTVFVVAHRLSTIENSDIILVMKDGNIIEQGSHMELIQKKGFYNQLYYSQFQ